MKYVIIINSAPLANQASLSAYHFANALLAKQHELLTVFFYQDAAYHGLTQTVIPVHEANIIQNWQTLARQHQLDLTICSAAALRRGVTLETNSGFHLAGLGYLLEICQQADKVINFG